VDFPGGDRIGQVRVVARGGVWAQVTQDNVLQHEDLRIFIGLVRADHQPRIVTDDLVHYDLDFAFFGGWVRILLPLRLWWNADHQPLHVHRAYARGFKKQTEQPGMKFELLNGDDRLLSPRGHHIIWSIYPQTASRDGETFHERHLQVIQFYPAVEAGAEGLDHSALKNWLRLFDHHFANRQQHNDCGERDPGHPSPDFVAARASSILA
jgi:hypothetical protein